MMRFVSITMICLCLVQPQKAMTQSLRDRVPADSIVWESPQDGGTPRDLSRIVQTGRNSYSIRAAFEEGGQSVLKHAVSRMDLVCKNNGTKPLTVTLEIDLSQEGKRTEYDNKPEAGMKWRDFLFIRQQHGAWKQINGQTKSWVSVVQFEAEPGITEIGLSPWYTYAEYLSFINSLPPGPFLKKKMIGKTDDNREHWEITITDTTVSDQKKKKIFWQAREHAYETFSSFAMEGLIPFLLSDEAAIFRKRYIITLHPMTNIDGVANGYEYRAGYDFPEPRTTQTGKLSFDAVDRLRPDYAVAWHNWIAPRDRNVVFYTDGDSGKPTPRAWLRFSQLFPSLRQWQHRWKDEDTPLKYNWEGRTLADHNIHQYAMKRYGTRIWGWEMPWWNVTVEEVRQAGVAFARAFLTTISEIQTQSVPPAAKNKTITTVQYGVHEFEIDATANLSNPWQDAMLVGEFTSPSGAKKIMDGFYDGDEKWKLRFSPGEQGIWTYRLRGEGVTILQEGSLSCIAPVDHGFIGIHPQNPYAFAYSDTTPFFPMGDTNYGLLDDSPETPALKAAYLKKRRRQRFNFVRMEAGHSPIRAAADPAWWAWGGTVQQPDLDRFNPIFFHQLDTLIWQMKKTGMHAELILLNYYRFPFTDTSLWTLKRERVWIHYLLSRYSAYSNIFMWTISNEYETHPDGKYRLDTIADVNWVKQTAAFIRQNDPYHHLLTVHPVISSNTRSGDTRTPVDLPWRIGGFYGSDTSLTVLSQQTGQSGEGVIWDGQCQCWNGDDRYLTASIDTDRVYRKPVINTENGYEFLQGQPTMRKQVHHTDKVRRSSWRIVCAGGYFAAGFSGTIGHSDIWNRIDAPHHYSFIVRDEGAGEQLSYLHRFFTALPYWKMQPYKNITGDAVALADVTGKTVVIYFPHGKTISLYWPGTTRWMASWFNPRTGKFGVRQPVIAKDVLTKTAPDGKDWVLLLQQ